MNEPADKSLHDRVRQQLHSYRPAYDPQDWERMQRALRRRRGWRRRILGSVGLIVLFVLGWFIGPPTTPKTAETALPTKLPATDEPVTSTSAPSKSSEPRINPCRSFAPVRYRLDTQTNGHNPHRTRRSYPNSCSWSTHGFTNGCNGTNQANGRRVEHRRSRYSATNADG